MFLAGLFLQITRAEPYLLLYSSAATNCCYPSLAPNCLLLLLLLFTSQLYYTGEGDEVEVAREESTTFETRALARDYSLEVAVDGLAPQSATYFVIRRKQAHA